MQRFRVRLNLAWCNNRSVLIRISLLLIKPSRHKSSDDLAAGKECHPVADSQAIESLTTSEVLAKEGAGSDVKQYRGVF